MALLKKKGINKMRTEDARSSRIAQLVWALPFQALARGHRPAASGIKSCKLWIYRAQFSATSAAAGQRRNDVRHVHSDSCRNHWLGLFLGHRSQGLNYFAGKNLYSGAPVLPWRVALVVGRTHIGPQTAHSKWQEARSMHIWIYAVCGSINCIG